MHPFAIQRPSQNTYTELVEVIISTIPHSLKSLMTGSLSYRNQSTDLHSKTMNWFLYDMELRHERVQ